MQLPLQITARDFELTYAIEAAIREKAGKLDNFCNRIMGCRVMIEIPHRHHQKGCLYHVRIDMTVPGGRLVAKREPHVDLYVALRDAFDAARRQLQGYARRRRGGIRFHEGASRARVIRLFSADGYGFLESADGREVYFHRDSVADDGFDRLQAGTEVRYVEARGDEGPRAGFVTIVGVRGSL